jgi:exopolysaccharide production protein ExoQ
MPTFRGSRGAPAVYSRQGGHSSFLAAALVWTLIVLMIVPEGFDYTVLNGQAPTSGGLLSRALWLGLLIVSGAILIARASLARLLVRSLNPFFVLFLVVAVVSIAWSIDPLLTVRRDIRLITIVLVAAAFMLSGWHPRRLQNVVRPLLTLMLLASVVFAFTAPDLAVHQETSPELLHAWRGLTNHKNTFGALACITLIFWVQGWLAREVSVLRALPGCLLSVACLLLSRSGTSKIAALAAIVFLVLSLRSSRNLRPYVGYLAGFITAATILYTLAALRVIPGLGVILAPLELLTDVDTSFTGRREIWWIIGDHVHLHPILGTGYGAYWAGPVPTSPSYDFILRMGSFYPGSAHNGYLEVLNDLGWLGLLCLIAYVFVQLKQSLRVLVTDRARGALYLAIFMQQVFTNLSESHWFSVLSMNFVIMTLVSVAPARQLLDDRLRAYYAVRQARAAMSMRPTVSVGAVVRA